VPGDRFQLDAVWKMILPCLMWCLWRERNDHSFEDHDRTLVELKALFFKTFFLSGAGLYCTISNFHAFLDLFSATR
jgi:hypothetical protein